MQPPYDAHGLNLIAAAAPSSRREPGEGKTRAALRLRQITLSAVRHIDSKAAERGFFILLMHVIAGLAHGLDADIQ